MYKPKQYDKFSKPHFGKRKNRPVKKLDFFLFVKKARDIKKVEKFIPQTNFNDYNICEKLKRNIVDHGYNMPTSIQEKAIPKLLLGKDLIGIANTGTGKTATFLIALLNKCYNDRNQRVLIVVPTRELAIQIKDEFAYFAKGMNMEALAIVGGANIKSQMYALRSHPHFVIATPGRLKDLTKRNQINLFMYQNVVLDEVDRMVDIGFIHDINFIVSQLPKIRQSLFFSATVDKKTEQILENFVSNPVMVSVKIQDTNNNIEQDVVKISNGMQKIDILHDMLISPGFDKVMVFGRTKWGAEKLAKNLFQRGFRVASIHGNKSQSQRQRAIEEFKCNRLQVLVATDVASRGLDIDNVTHVINYDAPTTYDDYVHRIGRTGRAGRRGVALTFVE